MYLIWNIAAQNCSRPCISGFIAPRVWKQNGIQLDASPEMLAVFNVYVLLGRATSICNIHVWYKPVVTNTVKLKMANQPIINQAGTHGKGKPTNH